MNGRCICRSGPGSPAWKQARAKVDGDKITLTGGWKGEKASYDASYAGSFVRRSAKLSGTQTWTYDGKSYNRTCSGAVKRPLAAFLPKQKQAQ